MLPVLGDFDLQFILDWNMSTRSTEVCHVIRCLSMNGISLKGIVSILMIFEFN